MTAEADDLITEGRAALRAGDANRAREAFEAAKRLLGKGVLTVEPAD